MTPGPLHAYESRIRSGETRPDIAQQAAVISLQNLYDDLIANTGRKRFLAGLKKKARIPGLYLYGGVGRGKSMLMDMFVQTASGLRVRRVHFHAFMIGVHAALREKRESWAKKGEGELLDVVARDAAKDIDVLCFDEFHVNDIADAMLLGPLFAALFDLNVTIIATSNYPPDLLYKDGLQRARFLPFIDVLKQNMKIINVDSGIDYRQRALSENGVYFWPNAEPVRARMESLFETLANHNPAPPTTLTVKGRDLPVQRAAHGIAWLTFEELCARPRGAEDYLALADAFYILFIDGVPQLDDDRRDWAKRFMTLIDALYDRQRQVVICAAAPPDSLYAGRDLAFEFARTVSRLTEMQSPEWFARNSPLA